MIIRKVYNYIYWRCYDLISITGNYDLGWGASHLLSLLMSILLVNFSSAYTVYELFSINQLMGIYILGFLIIELSNYLLFVRHEKYQEIISLYKEEKQLNKNVGRILLVVTIAYSIYLLF